MRKIVMYCDRCKKEFEKWNNKKAELYGVAEFVYVDGEPHLDGHLDLCESCYTELENWWNLTWTIDKGAQPIKANNEAMKKAK